MNKWNVFLKAHWRYLSLRGNAAGGSSGRFLSTTGVLVSLLVLITACQQQSTPQQSAASDETELEQRLVLNNANLEQTDNEGRPLWQVKAQKAEYSQDRQTAQLQAITGKLFRDGEVVLEVSADRGNVQRNAEKIFLRGQIVATDPRNGAVIRADELEWIPKDDLFLLRQDITGSHRKLKISAKEGRYSSQTQRLELRGAIEATLSDPLLQMKTEQVYWEIPQEKVISDRQTRIVQFRASDRTVTEQVVADRAQVELKTNTARLQQNVEMQSLDPRVKIATNSINWNYQKRTLESDRPIQLVQVQEQLMLTGNRGQLDLEQEIARLSGGVEGLNERNQAKLYADELIWRIPARVVEANGNVIYDQPQPGPQVTGTKAVARLEEDSVIVSGGGNSRVVTEIIPEP